MGNHPPLAIYLLLGVLCVVGSMLLGYSLSPSRNAHWLHRLSFAGITALAIDVILDLELPGRGLIRIDGEDAVLVELGRTLDARGCHGPPRAPRGSTVHAEDNTGPAPRRKPSAVAAGPAPGLAFLIGAAQRAPSFFTRLSLRTDKRGIHFLYERFAGPVVGP